jgi:hypothetical protein
MVETLPRHPKSSQSCFGGSASAGKLSTLVERTRMVERRRKQLAEFHRDKGNQNTSVQENIEIVKRGSSECNCRHKSINRANRLGHRSRVVFEQTSSENRLDHEVLQQMQEKNTLPRIRFYRKDSDQRLQ